MRFENIAGDMSVLMMLVVIAAFLVVGYFMVKSVVRDIKRAIKENGEEDTKYADRIIFKIVIMTLALGGVIWMLFGAYGPGRAIDSPDPASDGFRQLTEEAPDEKTEAEIEVMEDERKPSVLKEVEDHAAAEIDIDEEIRKAIERSKRTLNNK